MNEKPSRSRIGHAGVMRITRWIDQHRGWLETLPSYREMLTRLAEETGVEPNRKTLRLLLAESGIETLTRQQRAAQRKDNELVSQIADLASTLSTVVRRLGALEESTAATYEENVNHDLFKVH